MILNEAATRLLKLLEQTDEEEYKRDTALEHLNQAIHELCEENTFAFMEEFSSFTLEIPLEDNSESFPPGTLPPYRIGVPEYWEEIPGRALITDVLGCTMSNFSWIKRAWIEIDDEYYHFGEGDIQELLDTFKDETGTPEGWALSGEYIFWRPYTATEGTTFETRWLWQKQYEAQSSSSEPILLAQCPYGVLYKAASIASVWLLDDNRVPMFEQLAQRAIDRYLIRASMTNDGPGRAMEEYNGET